MSLLLLDTRDIRDYKNLCNMSFKQIADMTLHLSRLDGNDNFDYLSALEDICRRIDDTSGRNENFNFRQYNRPKRQRPGRPPRRRPPHRPRRRRKPPPKDKEDSGFFSGVTGMWNGMMRSLTFWDYFNVLGFQERSDDSGDSAEEKIDKNVEDYEYYDDYSSQDHAYTMLDELSARLQASGSSNQNVNDIDANPLGNHYVPFSEVFHDRKVHIYDNFRQKREANQRLAFVHYVYPRETAEHFDSFYRATSTK